MDYSKFPHQRGTPPSGAGERQARHLDTLGTPSLHRLNPDGSVSRKVNGRLYVDPAQPAQAQAIVGYEFWVNDDFRLYPTGLGSAGHLGVAPTDKDGVAIEGQPPGDYANGHAVFLSAAGKATPRYSTTLEPLPGQSPAWKKVTPRRATALTPSSGTKAEPDYFYTKWSWQDQKLFEHSWWKGNKSDWLLTSAIGFNYGLANNAPQRGPGTTAYSFRSNFVLKLGSDRQNDPVMSDSGFDIKTCAYSKAGVKVGASRQQGDKVWYRRAAVQTVTLPSGMRRDYVIHSDTHGRFTVWPLGEYQNTARYADLYATNPIAYADLPPSVAKVFTPEYPAWVTVPATTQDVEAQHWTWQFNKTGTRCATVAHKKIESWVWVWTKTNPGAQFGPDYLVGGKPLMQGAPFNNFYSTLNVGIGYLRSAPGRNADGSFRPEPNGSGWEYRRVREYRMKSQMGEQAFARAYLIDGVLVGCSQETGYKPPGSSDKDWEALPNTENYEPAFTYLPGLLELDVKVKAFSEQDPYAFTVAFDVRRSEFYDETSEYPKRYFVDAAYYVATPRTRDQDIADNLKDDDLLVAEVEVFFTPGQGITDNGPGWPTDKLAGNTWKYLTAGVQYAQGGRYIEGIPGHADFHSERRFHDHIDEPYLESALTGQFRADGVYAYYTVRKQETQAMVQRLCLVHNERWEFDGLDVLTEFFFAGPDVDRAFAQADGEMVGYPGRVFMPLGTTSIGSPHFEIGLARSKYLSENHMPATFVTHIDVADLRFLNFITRTYQRNAATPSDYASVIVPADPAPYLAWSTTRASRRYVNQVYPNHHLRIRGQAVRSILYQPDIPEFGPDPAATKIFPTNAVRLPSIPRGGKPCGNEGVTLAMQQEFAARFITPSLLPGNSIPAHPAGHWAACINRTQGGIFFDGPEEIPTATGVLISPLSGSTEGGASWFDAIHIHGKQDTTHKAVFNLAFGQDRDYSYWADPDGADEDEEFGGFMAGALWVET